MSNNSILRGAALSLAVGACAAPCVAGQPGDPQYFLEGMRCAGGEFGLRLPTTLPELMALAPLRQEVVHGVEAGEGFTITRKTLRFDGLAIGVVTFSNDAQRYWLASAEVRSTAWQHLTPFRLRQSIEDVRKRLGTVAQDDQYLRSIYAGESDSVRFESTRRGRVTAVLYECYTG